MDNLEQLSSNSTGLNVGNHITLESMSSLLLKNNELIQQNIKTEFKCIRSDIELSKTEVLESIGMNLAEINLRLDTLEEHNKLKDNIISVQEARISNLEMEIRKKNVIIFKLQELESSTLTLEDAILRLFTEKVGKQFNKESFETIYRVGKKKWKCNPTSISHSNDIKR